MCKAYDRQDCTIPKKCSDMPIELEGRPSSSIYAANLLSKSYVFIKILYPHLTVSYLVPFLRTAKLLFQINRFSTSTRTTT